MPPDSQVCTCLAPHPVDHLMLWHVLSSGLGHPLVEEVAFSTAPAADSGVAQGEALGCCCCRCGTVGLPALLGGPTASLSIVWTHPRVQEYRQLPTESESMTSARPMVKPTPPVIGRLERSVFVFRLLLGTAGYRRPCPSTHTRSCCGGQPGTPFQGARRRVKA